MIHFDYICSSQFIIMTAEYTKRNGLVTPCHGQHYPRKCHRNAMLTYARCSWLFCHSQPISSTLRAGLRYITKVPTASLSNLFAGFSRWSHTRLVCLSKPTTPSKCSSLTQTGFTWLQTSNTRLVAGCLRLYAHCAGMQLEPSGIACNTYRPIRTYPTKFW